VAGRFHSEEGPIKNPTDRFSAGSTGAVPGDTPADRPASRLVVGISGASGIIYGVRLLEVLRETGLQTHLILSEAAAHIAQAETGLSPEHIASLATFVHANDDLSAPVSSGSYPTLGMVVAPCSIKSLSAIAHSYNDTLLARAADVTLKERRRLVLVVRETPLHLGHLRLMAQAAECGAVILPPMPAFYHRPRTIADLVDQTVGKILDQFGLEHRLFRRWQGGCGLDDDVAE
jgi:4-hydroxy-3-polyprenylbenzoate decarboxylase